MTGVQTCALPILVTYVAYKFDDNGNISMMSGSTNDPDGKISRENAERKAKEKKAAEEKAAERRKNHAPLPGIIWKEVKAGMEFDRGT